MKVKKSDNHPIILFDGVCNMCNQWVQFVIKRDSKALFKFASLQSNLGDSIIKHYKVNTKGRESIVLIEEEKVYIESTAVLKIISRLEGPIKMVTLFWIIPKPIRDQAYRIIAKRRYRLFGKKEACMVPTKEMQSRFIKDKIESRAINEEKYIP
ncbi:thiol-disulfide oxidoreductase DCC family protein [Aneurinibacillus aneurinilyticus]|uniref:thiol-disulfide oxidoreductase DCC family protein n=1 Tax=Aneurinibacillus aneurinilyticus TaxID=1391 RepID=UPI002E1D32A3|nr:thiol-disulfide oxidoreductase DCC family protein [Aneurinibacillus aneurinilyticus]